MRLQVQSLALLSRLRIWNYHELWHRPAATAPIRPLAWEPPYAVGEALQKQHKSKRMTPSDKLARLHHLKWKVVRGKYFSDFTFLNFSTFFI